MRKPAQILIQEIVEKDDGVKFEDMTPLDEENVNTKAKAVSWLRKNAKPGEYRILSIKGTVKVESTKKTTVREV